ncbi:hypothetical protein J6590_011278 [Homalodisca vitripennis]|nr:hypothetical protein J6590_011278 [Homalodisca vitripennis]
MRPTACYPITPQTAAVEEGRPTPKLSVWHFYFRASSTPRPEAEAVCTRFLASRITAGFTTSCTRIAIPLFIYIYETRYTSATHGRFVTGRTYSGSLNGFMRKLNASLRPQRPMLSRLTQSEQLGHPGLDVKFSLHIHELWERASLDIPRDSSFIVPRYFRSHRDIANLITATASPASYHYFASPHRDSEPPRARPAANSQNRDPRRSDKVKTSPNKWRSTVKSDIWGSHGHGAGGWRASECKTSGPLISVTQVLRVFRPQISGVRPHGHGAGGWRASECKTSGPLISVTQVLRVFRPQIMAFDRKKVISGVATATEPAAGELQNVKQVAR